MKLAALISGGKDSIYAMYKAMQEGHEIVVMASFIAKNQESYMFHLPNIKHTEKFEKALGIKHEQFMISGDKEFEVNEMKAGLFWIKREYEIEGVVTGAIQSNYQKERIDKACEELELKSLTPLWQINQEKYIMDFIKDGFKAKIVGVFAEGLDKKWLGQDIDKETVDKLKKLNEKYSVSLVGEGGEYETFVYDGPIFKKRIDIEDTKIEWNKNSGILEFTKVKLEKK